MDRKSVPKLNLGSIPLVPGFKSHRDVPILQPWYRKKTIGFTEAQERSGPEADCISHQPGPFTARAATTGSDSSGGGGSSNNNNKTDRAGPLVPNSPSAPRAGTSRPANSQRAKWLRFDRETLRFYMYFQESVPESPEETYRIRRVVLFYYRADDTLQLTEPKCENSGLAQGSFLKKVPIASLAGVGDKPCLELRDLRVGFEIPLYGRTFKIVDADKKTREFFQHDLGVHLAPALPYPTEPRARNAQELRERLELSKAQVQQAKQAAKPQSNLRSFLKYGQKALHFTVMWDDTESLYGERRYFLLSFFLADDSIQLREQFKPNSGREDFPKFMSRRTVQRADGQPFTFRDFVCGSYVEVNARKFLVLSCDDASLDFYAQHGIKQNFIKVAEEKKQLPRMPEPPYNGFGSEEDSLGSFYNLIPKPPRKDHERQRLYEDQLMHLRLLLTSDLPQDKDRVLDLTFYLADQTLTLYEPKKRNSGITGGKFLERSRYLNPATGGKFCADDLKAALQAAVEKKSGVRPAEDNGDLITILGRTFRVDNGDDFAYSFFGLVRPAVANNAEDPEDVVFSYIVNQLLMRRLNIRELFKKADKDNSRSIGRDEFMNMLQEAGVKISEHELELVMSKFNSGRDEIWYQDFCDALSTHWTPPVRDSNSRVEEIQALLLQKFRHSKTQLRVLFRNFDKDKNGKLTFSEFKRLLKHYTLEVSDGELAGIMALYDKSQSGSIDYNNFCDTVYECDFSSVLDQAKQVTTSEAAKAIHVEDYLKRIQSQERSLESHVASKSMRDLIARVAPHSAQLEETFLAVSKTGTGNLNSGEFVRAVDSIVPLSGGMREELAAFFFPPGVESVNFSLFMATVSKIQGDAKV